MYSISPRLLFRQGKARVSFYEAANMFSIEYGNVNWSVERDQLGGWRGYLLSVHEALVEKTRLGSKTEMCEPIYLSTRDEIVTIKMTVKELKNLLIAIEGAEAVLNIESPRFSA